MRLIAKVIRLSRAKFHCNRLTAVQDIQDKASLIFWYILYLYTLIIIVIVIIIVINLLSVFDRLTSLALLLALESSCGRRDVTTFYRGDTPPQEITPREAYSHFVRKPSRPHGQEVGPWTTRPQNELSSKTARSAHHQVHSAPKQI